MAKDKISSRWYESAPALLRVKLSDHAAPTRLPIRPSDAAAQLDRWQAQGIAAIEVFAPAEGGKSYGGLDAKNHYRIDPALGTMDDFGKLVDLAHDRGIAFITFDNLGYSHIAAPHFLKACDDVREGRDSREVRWYLWSKQADAPPPGKEIDRFYLVRDGSAGWVWSERAQRFYWSKWPGKDDQDNHCRLPQYDWGAPEWQNEAEKIVRFWMDTGIDGMVIDAVTWYVGCDWEIGRRRMTDVIARYPRAFRQPEGAGGFRDDPSVWITQGGWNCVQDYGLGIWWEKESEVLRIAIEQGDPRSLERTLQKYHDRVVAAGGVLYAVPPRFEDTARQRLAIASVVAFGDLVVFADFNRQPPEDTEATVLLRLKAMHPALHQLSTRRQLATDTDDRCYACLRTAQDGSERMLVVLNFSSEPQTITVSGVPEGSLTDLRTQQVTRAKG